MHMIYTKNEGRLHTILIISGFLFV